MDQSHTPRTPAARPAITSTPAPTPRQRGQYSAPSGSKYVDDNGNTAIRNGIKRQSTTQSSEPSEKPAAEPRKPNWLRVRIGSGKRYKEVLQTVAEHNLATVCEESHCPNIGECWNHGTATIMLMGSVCTRACKFCAVDTGNPHGLLDASEPANVARSVALMNLRYVVLTSVDRDDLPDGGAAHYAACIRAIKTTSPGTAVEALTPDFSGVLEHVQVVVDSGLEVFAQNIETVERLTHIVRDPRAGYDQTMQVLRAAKQHRPEVLAKSSIMLGIGETDDEVVQTLEDLRNHRVDIVTLGQYLRPTPNHLPIDRWVTPAEFERFRAIGLEMGFTEVASGPLVRSSYRADRILDGNNLGLGDIPIKQL